MFETLPEWHTKISLRGALLGAVLLSFGAGAFLGELLIFAVRLHATTFELAEMLLYSIFCAGGAARFYSLTLSRVREQQLATTLRQ